MFQVTGEATKHMADTLESVNAPEDAVLRLIPQENSLGLGVGQVEPDDLTYEHEGRTVLVVNRSLADHLEALELGMESVGEGEPRLQLRQAG